MLERYIERVGEKEDRVVREERRSIPELDMTVDRSERLSSLFITRVPDNLAELDAAVAAGDAQRVREKAHKLKGSCLAVGAGVMAEQAEVLQHEAEQGQLEKAAEHAGTLRQQYGRVAALLEEEMGRSRTSRRTRSTTISRTRRSSNGRIRRRSTHHTCFKARIWVSRWLTPQPSASPVRPKKR